MLSIDKYNKYVCSCYTYALTYASGKEKHHFGIGQFVFGD